MYFSGGTGSNVSGFSLQLDQLDMVDFSWVLSVTHVLSIFQAQSIVSVM